MRLTQNKAGNVISTWKQKPIKTTVTLIRLQYASYIILHNILVGNTSAPHGDRGTIDAYLTFYDKNAYEQRSY